MSKCSQVSDAPTASTVQSTSAMAKVPSWSPYRTGKVLCHAAEGVFAGVGDGSPVWASTRLMPPSSWSLPVSATCRICSTSSWTLISAGLNSPATRAAVDDDHPLADLVDVEEVVVDEDARLAGVLDPAHEVERLPRLRHRQAHGRLVEDDQLGLEVERAGDRDALALAARHRADEGVGRDRLRGEAQELQHQLLGLGAHPLQVEQPEAGRPLATHEDVPPQRLLVGERTLLVDGLDPQVAGALHREVMDLLALPPDLCRQSGAWNPVMILIRVDLPAPLSPSSPTISSTPTVRLTSCSARTWSNDLEMCSSSRRAVVAVSMDVCRSFAESGGATSCAAALIAGLASRTSVT